MGTTTDRDAECLGHGSDEAPVPQNACYLVLSDEERAKGFVRPVRTSYQHVGAAGPTFPTRALTPDETARYGDEGYAVFEVWPDGFKPSSTGRFWTQKELDAVAKGCNTVTMMGRAIAETYAREPHFYGSTYCVGCRMHRPVGAYGEFVWIDDRTRVGT